MTELLSYKDSYIKEFEAEILEVIGNGVVLDKTAFYPGGGGQPYDTGKLSIGEYLWEVVRIVRLKGKIVHEILNQVSDISDLSGTVRGAIDWDKRYKLMRTHTALHILCGVVWRDYGAHVTGGVMKPLAARMDFELESMSSSFAEEIEKKINDEVASSRPIYVKNMLREQAFTIPDLIRTKINLLPENIREVRVIDIDGLDMQADGGTHVANTKEVGRINVIGHESKGRINKRLKIEIEP